MDRPDPFGRPANADSHSRRHCIRGLGIDRGEHRHVSAIETDECPGERAADPMVVAGFGLPTPRLHRTHRSAGSPFRQRITSDRVELCRRHIDPPIATDGALDSALRQAAEKPAERGADGAVVGIAEPEPSGERPVVGEYGFLSS